MGLRDHALLFAYFKTACRSSAIAYARIQDLERTDSDWYLKVVEKGDKERKLSLLESTPAILAWLEASGIDQLREKEAPLFPAMEKDGKTPSRRHLTSRQILRIVKKYARQVGIQVERSGRGIGTHSLRKTALTNALQHGAKMEQVRSLAGHADIRTTQLYYQEGEKDAEDAARHIQIR